MADAGDDGRLPASARSAVGWRFLLQPRWLLSHLLVLTLVVVMVNLGFWQLRRLDQRRDRNDVIEAALAAEPVEVTDLLQPGDDEDAAEAVRFRRVTATGVFDASREVVVRNRTLDGVAGAWLVTPLEIGKGGTVAVNRGFVATGSAADPARSSAVTVEGVLIAADRLDRTARIDLSDLLDDPDVLPALLQVTEEGSGDASLPVPLPDLGEGPHFGYAVQWFIFSTIAVVGYPLVLRRVAQQRRHG